VPVGLPLWLLAELTYRCPLQCPYCSNPLDFAQQGQELSTAQWFKVMAEAREMGAAQIGFSGGEPLVRQDLAELIGEARRLGYYTNLITSGIGLTEARLRALKDAGLRHIQLGFQSTDHDMARQLAGVDVLERKLGMAQLIKSMDFPMVLNVPITRQNIGQVPDIIEFAVELGVEYLELANVQYYNWALFNRDALMPTHAELQRAGFASVSHVASLTQTDQHFDQLVEALTPQGRLALIDDPAQPLDVMKLKRKSLSLHWELMFTRSLFETPDMIEQHHLLQRVSQLVDLGVLRTTLGEHFGTINAANLRRAHALLESGKAKGKIVLEGF